MCKLCDERRRQVRFGSRRDFLKATAATGLAASSLGLFAPRPARADAGDMFDGSGRRGRRYIIRGGSVMSMDPKVGDFAQADVLIEGNKILAVGPNLHAGDAAIIDAKGRIVMPGFIDTHHHQFETALRSFLADGVLINDGSGSPRRSSIPGGAPPSAISRARAPRSSAPIPATNIRTMRCASKRNGSRRAISSSA